MCRICRGDVLKNRTSAWRKRGLWQKSAPKVVAALKQKLTLMQISPTTSALPDETNTEPLNPELIPEPFGMRTQSHRYKSGVARWEKGKVMTHEEAKWQRLELQCIRTLLGMGLHVAPLRVSASQPADAATHDSPGSTTKFGGTVNAPANAIAVGAIGNAFATGVDLDGIPTTAEVIPVYSSADIIEGDGASRGASPRVQRILDRVSYRTPATEQSGPPQLPMSGQLLAK